MRKTQITISLGLLILTLVLGKTSLAYISDQNADQSLPSLVNPLDYLKNIPLQGITQNLGVGTSIPSLSGLSQFLDTKNLSSSDITSMLKAVAVLAINLFLIVIQVITGILKALLPFLSR